MSHKLIIIIENDSNLRRSIALVLQRAGYLIKATDHVNNALELLTTCDCHMLISDFNIPETRDILLSILPGKYPRLPIVILTDQSTLEVERQSRQSRAHFLLKPVAPEQLIEAVGSILQNSNNSNHAKNRSSVVDLV